MGFVEESFKLIYPDKNFNYDVSLRYSGRFKPYNANIMLRGNNLILNLSREWKEISDDIRIGLIQTLLLKIFKGKKQTMNIDLYNSFIRKLHLAIPKTATEPVEESFNRVNDKYFYGIIEKPNLKWGSGSLSRLGYYEYQTDMINVSSIFRNAPSHLIDYIMYHEMLHKKHKFNVKNGRSYHHTSMFKKDEKEFENWKGVERELKRFCRGFRWKGMFRFF